MNEIKLVLPELRKTKLSSLRQGNCFMTARDFYSEGTQIYMVLKNDYPTHITAVRLQDGSTVVLSGNLHVVQLTVSLQAKLYDPKDDLPF